MYESDMHNQYPSKRWSNSGSENLTQNPPESSPYKKHALNYPKSNLVIFSQTNNQLADYYEGLNRKIIKIIEKLQIEIEPTDLSGFSSIQVKAIKLSPIHNSLLSKRRISILIN